MKYVLILLLMCSNAYANESYCLGYYDSTYKDKPSKRNYKILKYFESKVQVLSNIDKEYYTEGVSRSNEKLNEICKKQYYERVEK